MGDLFSLMILSERISIPARVREPHHVEYARPTNTIAVTNTDAKPNKE
jgi:hypothetical protein